MSTSDWTEVKPWSKKQYSQHVDEVTELLSHGEGKAAQDLIIRNRLNHYAKIRRQLDEKGTRKVDNLLWRDLRSAILSHSYWRFREKFRDWYHHVDGEITRWERKLVYEKYLEDGKRRGVWGSPVGAFVAKYFPSELGLDMKQPPAYFDVWSEADRRLYENYENHLQGRMHQHKIFWGALGFLMVAGVQYHSISIRSQVLSRNPLMPFVGAFGGYTHIFKHKRRVESMDKLLNSEGTFLSAKARLIADDVLWPVERHNREYLRHLPRDEFDEFVWSVKDRDVAFGTFDRNEWGFTLGDIKEKALIPDDQKPQKTYTDYWTEFKGFYYQYVGKGYEWDSWINESKAKQQQDLLPVDPNDILRSSIFEQETLKQNKPPSQPQPDAHSSGDEKKLLQTLQQELSQIKLTQ